MKLLFIKNKAYKFKKIIINAKYSILILGIAYIQIRRKTKDLWFDNDFKDIFPEVFSPWTERYKTKDDDISISDCILSLKHKVKEDIAERRKLNAKNNLEKAKNVENNNKI